jgi:hypothetical protein
MIRNPHPSQRTRSAIVLIGLVGSAVWALAANPASSVAANGVHFDPDSPAGKEYALPLDQARNEAAGDEGSKEIGSDGESAQSASLFGEGVSGGGRAAAQTDGSATGSPADGQAGPGGNGGSGGASAAAKLTDGGGGYSLLAGIGLVAVVLLAGLGLGLALRSVQRVRTG